MPPKYKSRKPRVARRGRLALPGSRLRRALMFNPQPVFIESYLLPGSTAAAPYTLAPNSGGQIAVSMDNIPQLAQYSSLYQKYRILKAKFICIPTHNTASADINSELAPGGLQQVGLSRIVYAVNDSPNQVAAIANEQQVLVDNGCKIICGSPKFTMSCRPVPNTEDTSGVRMTLGRKYINFGSPNVSHFGITWYHTQPVIPPNSGFGVPYLVYVKLTFQLADPR